MQILETPTVRDIAANSLAAVRIFERLGIDYCCGGKRPLEEVCREKGYDVDAVRRELADAEAGLPVVERDWNVAPLAGLIGHIVATHHSYLRRELPAIATRLEKVYRVYNQRYGPTLQGLPEIFASLQTELQQHMWKEENILFPAVAAAEEAIDQGKPLPPTCFGTVADPILMMEAEHESAGQALAKIREITGDFAVPGYACVTYRALMSGLADLERDLHMHIHLENNILFPRAADLERRAAGTRS
jgi:regulator of cell morphogenesis and NO signaling